MLDLPYISYINFSFCISHKYLNNSCKYNIYNQNINLMNNLNSHIYPILGYIHLILHRKQHWVMASFQVFYSMTNTLLLHHYNSNILRCPNLQIVMNYKLNTFHLLNYILISIKYNINDRIGNNFNIHCKICMYWFLGLKKFLFCIQNT